MGVFTSTKPKWRRSIVTAMLNALSTNPGAAILIAPKIHLLSATLAFTETTPIATFTAAEATFTGYVAPALGALIGPTNTIPDTIAMLANASFVVGANPTITNTIYGYYIDHNTAADWVMAELFPSPFGMSLQGDFVDLTILMPELMFVQTQ